MWLESAIILLLSLFAFGEISFQLKSVPSEEPEQIHLSIAASHPQLAVTWTTYVKVDSVVQFGKDRKLQSKANGNVTEFVDKGNRTHYIHRVILTDLEPLTKYHYRCGSKGKWSDLYSFKTLTADTDWSPKMVVIGDMGFENAMSFGAIKSEVATGEVDVLMHNGDLAYNLASGYSSVGDAFMRMMQPVVANFPYQTSCGNHEWMDTLFSSDSDFSNYVNRFSMYDMSTVAKGSQSNHFYAFHLGAALIVVFNTEFYIYKSFYSKEFARQEQWLKSVLAKGNTAESRKSHPWIIVFAHRPLYCSSLSVVDCALYNTFYLTFEDLLYQSGVDLAVWAHVHNYERTLPVYKSTVKNGSAAHPYTDPRATVHIVNGAGGSTENLDSFVSFHIPKWSAVRQRRFGFGIIKVVNSTHLIYQQKDEKNKIIDTVTIIQNHHGPFGN